MKPSAGAERLARDLASCEALARSHYENFAIGSRLLPRSTRRWLAAIYAVVRVADDLADEEDATPNGSAAARLDALDAWERGLAAAAEGGDAPHFAQRAAGAAVRSLGLPLDSFRALFRAFRRDLVQTRYATYADLLSYCRDSANPVGELVMRLFSVVPDERMRRASDAICTGLQLVNHWQDVACDARRGRLYLPLEDCARFGADPEAILRGEDSPELRRLIEFETARARELLESGGELLGGVGGRLRLEVALFRRGGLAACDALARAEYAVAAGAPRVETRDRLAIVVRGLRDAVTARSWDPAGEGTLDPRVRKAYEHCAAIVRRSGSSFSAAFWMLPAPRRRALHAVYAFCRLADDIADDPSIAGDRLALIARWRSELEAAYLGKSEHPVGIALGDAVHRFRLPQEVFEDLLLGVESDLRAEPFERFEDLRRYCYRVASTVGILVVNLLGARGPRVREWAETLGIAVQLTNVLRDVGNDAASGRIYLPQEDLVRFGVRPETLLAGEGGDALRLLLAYEAERARLFYERADALLPVVERRRLRPALAMGAIYRALLDEIHERGFPVGPEPIRLSKPRRLAIAARTWLGAGEGA